MQINFEIVELIVQKRLGSLNPIQQQRLEDWVNTSTYNKACYRRLMNGDSFTDYGKLADRIDMEQVCAVLNRKMYRNKRSQILKYLSLSAAIIVLLIGSTVFLMNHKNISRPTSEPMVVSESRKDSSVILTLSSGERISLAEHDVPVEIHKSEIPQTVGYNKIEVPQGGEYFFLLSDGTKVWLNAETTIIYPVIFKDKREIKLIGEAYFEVTPDSTKPFVIATEDHLKVEVLGTSFNVNNYRDNGNVVVTLVKGMVAVEDQAHREILSPNQQARFDRVKGILSVHDITDITPYIAWKNGLFIFEKETLSVIMNTLSQWYGMEICYRNITPDILGHFSIKINRTESIGSILAMLHQITGISYSIEGKRIYLYQEN